MLDLGENITLPFQMPATDPLGREEVLGELEFQPEVIKLKWKLRANEFLDQKDEFQIIDIHYSKVLKVDIEKKWLRPIRLVFTIKDPDFLSQLPTSNLKDLVFEMEKDFADDLEKVKSYVEYKHSSFLFEQNNARFNEVRNIDSDI